VEIILLNKMANAECTFLLLLPLVIIVQYSAASNSATVSFEVRLQKAIINPV
jgi:hypothetical protein